MDAVNERFVRLISELRLNTNSFSKSIGKSYTAIKSITDGKTKPGFDVLEAVFETYPQISRDWLMTGEGSLFREDRSQTPHFGNEVTEKIEEHFRKLEEFYHEQLRAKDQQIDRLWSLLGKPKGCPGVANLYVLIIQKIETAPNQSPIFLNRGYKFGHTPTYL